MKLPFEPLKRQARLTLPETAENQPLLQYISARFDYCVPERWMQFISEGRFALNGQPAGADVLLHAGDSLEFLPPEIEEPPVSWDIAVLYQNDDLLVLNKPGNLPCHPAGKFFNHTLWAWLKQKMQLEHIHFLSRLDRETSGIIAVAINPATAPRLQKRTFGKTYLAIVHGNMPQTFQAKGFLAHEPTCPIRKMRHFYPECALEIPKPNETAWTDFTLLATSRDQDFSLVQAVLHTGRTHQIRATLHSLGFPMVGDKMYGLDPNIFLRHAHNELTSDDEERLIMPRQALHAWKISWPLLQGSDQEIQAPLPEDYCETVKKLFGTALLKHLQKIPE